MEDGLESALIIEDDADWDTHLKSQLPMIATGAGTFFQPSNNTPRSPYGDDWDLLWLGHCGERFPEEVLDDFKDRPLDEIEKISRKYTMKNDRTVPPPQFVTGNQDYINHPYERWVHVTGSPLCTFAYALSQRGARKVLYELSVNHLEGPIDEMLAKFCRLSIPGAVGLADHPINGGFGINCLTVTPPIIYHHRAKGRKASHSDINNWSDEILEKGRTRNIMWSARNNIHNMIAGTPPEIQFDSSFVMLDAEADPL